MTNKSDQTIPRATGLLVIEVSNSNPNGDPDRESDPRQRSHDQRGMITGVSFKRKMRDLVDEKDGAVWRTLGTQLADDEFDILEARRHDRNDVEKLLANDFEVFKRRFWDARVFGNTFLEKGIGDTIRTGVAQFTLALSVAPVRLERLTMTKKAAAQKDKDRGMAPLGYRVVEHGIYCMPFFVNPTAALKSGCTKRDIGLLLRLIPYAYPHTRSAIRPFVEVRHAWYAEHTNGLGSFSEFEFIEALTPRRKGNSEAPSSDKLPLREQYDVPGEEEVSKELQDVMKNFRDLCQNIPDWCDDGASGA